MKISLSPKSCAPPVPARVLHERPFPTHAGALRLRHLVIDVGDDVRPDVDVDRELEIGERFVERVPREVGGIGEAALLGLPGHDDAAEVHRLDPLRLLDRRLDVPDRERRHGEEPPLPCGLELGAGVVVHLDARGGELLVLAPHQVAHREQEQVRVDDRREDPLLVHQLDARDRVVRRLHHEVERWRVRHHVLVVFDRLPTPGRHLVAVAVDVATGAGRAHGPHLAPLEEPALAALVVLTHLRHQIGVLLRRPRGPDVEGLAPVGVVVDDLEAFVEPCLHHCRVLPSRFAVRRTGPGGPPGSPPSTVRSSAEPGSPPGRSVRRAT